MSESAPRELRLTERRLDYDEVQAAKRQRGAWLKARLGYRRGVRRRIRDPEERTSLIRLDLARLQRAYASGEREWIAPRRLLLRL